MQAADQRKRGDMSEKVCLFNFSAFSKVWGVTIAEGGVVEMNEQAPTPSLYEECIKALLRERTWKPITEMSRDDMETGMNFILWSPKTHAGPHEGRYWTQENEWCDTDGYVMKPTLFMPLPTPPQEETAGPHRVPA